MKHCSVTGSTLNIFADDVTVYKVVTSVSDCHVLQEDCLIYFVGLLLGRYD